MVETTPRGYRRGESRPYDRLAPAPLPVNSDDRPRCWWPDGLEAADPLMLTYHDTEWGVPVAEDRDLFERLALESFQAGLAWVTILRKREAFRKAFDRFDPGQIAGYDEADRARLLADAGIVRNRAKIDATIGNAASFLAVVSECGGFASYLAGQLPRPAPTLPAGATWANVPASTSESDALSADLRRRGFRFVGSTIVYAFMQSVGLVDDHLPGCFRYRG
jgi:DNA-3-methyladenine glycosylase I